MNCLNQRCKYSETLNGQGDYICSKCAFRRALNLINDLEAAVYYLPDDLQSSLKTVPFWDRPRKDGSTGPQPKKGKR